jgi:hypothetical protein
VKLIDARFAELGRPLVLPICDILASRAPLAPLPDAFREPGT